jgi:phosphatidylglycerophosphate synthase
MAEAKYVVTEKSFVTPLIKRFCVRPILSVLPSWISPNTITLFGAAMSMAAFALVVWPYGAVVPRYLLAALFTFVYLVVDNLDGAQARKTGRASPFGEVLDHWLDTLNGGYLAAGWAIAAGMDLRYVVPLVALTTLSFYATIWEQHITGRLFIGMVNQTEGCLSTCIFYVVLAFAGNAWVSKPLLFDVVTPMHLLALWQGGTCAWVLVTCVLRTRKHLKPFDRRATPLVGTAALCLGYAVGAYLQVVSPWWMLAGAILTNTITSGRTIIARAGGAPMPATDLKHGFLLVVVLAISAVAPIGQLVRDMLCGFAIFYVVIRMGLDARTAMFQLRHHLHRDELLGRLVFVLPRWR